MDRMGEEDVVVHLCSSDQVLLDLRLHSRVLAARSEFFASRLSQRWDSPLTGNGNNAQQHGLRDGLHIGGGNNLQSHHNGNLHDGNPSPINISVAADGPPASTYKQCIELMYVPRSCIHSCRPFSGVEDALSVLQVAAELLFLDCVHACLEYLEMVLEWTTKEEASIREVLESLQLVHVNIDLTARLSLPQGISPNRPMRVMRGVLVSVLQSTGVNLKNIDPSKPIPKAAVLLAWNESMKTLKESYYRWEDELITIFSDHSNFLRMLVDLEVADPIIKAWSTDSELVDIVVGRMRISKASPLFSVLDVVAEALLNGKVLLPQSVRRTFVITWQPVAILLAHHSKEPLIKFRKAFNMLLTSLPVLERQDFYKKLLENWEPSESFETWYRMVKQLHMQHGDTHEQVLAMEYDQ